ncbi:MAG: hypothetical protein IKO19_04090 [Candidatus Riflebacteria bacterium]|nr:hypothetical protein [Candidatus Riflebacteria bacterium]
MKKILLLIVYIICSSFILSADELSTIEKAAIMANNRLTQGILLTEIKDEKSFEEQAGKQIEFALISLNAENLLTEDWYDLVLYCLARKHKYYNLALSILKKEYEIEKYPRLRKWIQKRINLLQQKDFCEEDFDINSELSDLRKSLF